MATKPLIFINTQPGMQREVAEKINHIGLKARIVTGPYDIIAEFASASHHPVFIQKIFEAVREFPGVTKAFLSP